MEELPERLDRTPEIHPEIEDEWDDCSAVGLVHVDSALRITVTNSAFRELVTVGHAESIGMSFPDFFRPTPRPSLREHFDALMTGRQPGFSVPLTLVDATGRAADCRLTCVRITPAPRPGACAALATVVVPDTPPGVRTVAAPVVLGEVPAQILEGVAYGLSTQQLASRLALSSHGVDYHVGAMLRKLDVPNRSALVARAYALGILVPHCWPPRVRPRHTARRPAPAGTARADPTDGPRPDRPDPARDQAG
ncbi:LuxR C-terminal-related transcriptional regulator [Streptomyces sp. NPDC091279]|uniref:LuxR C-terminal-related transcriptional regulator n=1 Tax=Streptomyces sp. NPDC091279 TaxID=3365983 RepID=UPI0037FDE6B8